MLTSRLSELYDECECDESLKLMHKVQKNFKKAIEKIEGRDNTNSKELKLKFFLCVLEKLINEEHYTNGANYLLSLFLEENFLKAVSAICLEVIFKKKLKFQR